MVVSRRGVVVRYDRGAAGERRLSAAAQVAQGRGLTDNQTAAPGSVAVAFRGRPDTRSFGVRTCGLSTSNRGFVMSDGATLILTTATLAGHNRTCTGMW